MGSEDSSFDRANRLPPPVIGMAGLTQPAPTPAAKLPVPPKAATPAPASTHAPIGSPSLATSLATPLATPLATAAGDLAARPTVPRTIGAVSDQPMRWPVTFTGSGSEYFRIWIVNLLLMLVTFGIYYPWAKVRRLRYFYGNTQVAGHAFDFHGNPRTMLRGQMLVGALLFVYSAAGKVSPTAGLIALVIVAALWPLLFRASLRFKMAQTSWRGLRFQFDGGVADAYKALLPAFVPSIAILVCLQVIGAGGAANGGEADNATNAAPSAPALAALGGTVLVALLCVPLMLWALKHYQHNHLRLASSRTEFVATATAFYGVFWQTALVLLGAAAASVLVVGGLAWTVISMLSLSGSSRDAGGWGLVAVLVGAVAYAMLLMLAYPYFTSRMQNLVWSRTATRAIRFDSALRLQPLFVLTLKNWLLVAITFGLYWPFAAVSLAKIKLQAVTVLADENLDHLVARQRDDMRDASGEAAADLFGIDVGL